MLLLSSSSIMPHLIKIQKATFLQLNWEMVAFELQNV